MVIYKNQKYNLNNFPVKYLFKNNTIYQRVCYNLFVLRRNYEQ